MKISASYENSRLQETLVTAVCNDIRFAIKNNRYSTKYGCNTSKISSISESV